jgi:glycosyltransferase involved in cell wall biosynthesis
MANIEELQEKTWRFVKNERILKEFSLRAQKESLRFSKEKFCQKLIDLLKE